MSTAAVDPPTSRTGDSALLARFVRERDQAAFGDLVGRYETVVMGAALRRTGNVELARDVSQQVFVTLARKAGSLVGHTRLGGWLYRTASFQAARVARSENRRRRRESTFAAGNQPSAEQPGDNTWEPLEQAIAKMPEKSRELIVMHYFQDRAYNEMAAELGVSEVATRKRMSRALAELGERLEQNGVTAAATKILAGAVAAQAGLKSSPTLAANALAASAASASIASTFTMMTSTNALKIAAVATLLGAVPLGLQWNQTRQSEQALALVLKPNKNRSAPPAALRTEPERDALVALIDHRRTELAEISTSLEVANKRLKSAKHAVERLEDELVISHGRPEDLARRLAPIVKVLARYESAEEEPSGPEEVALMQQMMGALSELQSLPRLDSFPESKARFVATLVTEVGGFEADVTAAIEAALILQFETAKEEGLIFEKRPPVDSPQLGSWNERYNAASLAHAKAIEPLLPAAAVESHAWKLFSEPGENAGIAEMYGALMLLFSPENEPVREPAGGEPEPESDPQ